MRAQELIEIAQRTTEELFGHLADLIDQAYRRPDPDTILGRMIINGPGMYGLTPDQFNEEIMLTLAERLVGGTDTLAKAITNVVNYLLDHPETLAAAQLAAAGTSDKDYQDLSAIIRECLRFDPVAPMIFRYCEQDQYIGNNLVKAGTIVCLLTKAAMFDDKAFPKPFEFDPTRPPDRYLHFGEGVHHCAGRSLAEQILYLVIRSLLVLPDFRRAAGPTGYKQETLQLPELVGCPIPTSVIRRKALAVRYEPTGANFGTMPTEL